MRRGLRLLGTLLLVGGILTLAWAVLVWRWQDPFTALYPTWQQHRLSAQQCATMLGKTIVVNTIEESIRLNTLSFPSIIVSASGMATGGRVLHHLKAYAPDARNTILFAGFQAAGTRGAAMVAGADAVKIHGAYVPVRAEVANLETLSAHADHDELLAWLDGQRAPRRVFVTHGEPVAADALRLAIEERHGWPCTVPEYRDSREL